MDERTAPPPDDIALKLGLDVQRNPKERRGRLLRYGAAGLALLLVAGYFLTRPAPIRFVSEPLARGSLTVTVSATGTLKPLNQVDVGAEISGRIVALNADYNDHVTKDEVLAQLDKTELAAKVLQSEANVANAEATMVEARLKRDRIQALRGTGTSSRQDLEGAQAAFDRAAASVKQAHALLDVDRNNLSRTDIRSPIDGIVLDRKVEVGQTVASMFQTPILFTIAEDLKRMRLQIDVDEADVGRVRVGQSASFTVDAYTGRRFAATVQQFRNAPQTSEGVVTYPVVLDLENPDLLLRPGMTANAEILTARVDEALLLPNGALRFTPPGYAAVKVDDAHVKAVTIKAGAAPPSLAFPSGFGIAWTSGPMPHLVKLGASDGIHTAIESGDLKAGDAVLVDVERKAARGP
jgi:HlyD family secretion protein